MIGEFRQTRRELIRVFFISQQQHVSNKQARYKAQTSIAHHVPLKLFFALHEVEAKFTEKQLRAVIVLGWKRREIPCIYLISPKFNLRDIFHLCEFFMFPQAGCIKLLMSLLPKRLRTNEQEIFFALNAQRDNASTNIQIINLHVTFK